MKIHAVLFTTLFSSNRRISHLGGAATLVAVLSSAPALCAEGLVFDQPELKLGRMKAFGTISRSFPFRVEGDAPAEIVEIRPSCGCLRSPFTPRVFKPGERGEVPLLIHATSQADGRKRFELRLTVRDPRERTIVLSAEVELQSDVRVEPANLIIHLPDGETSTQTIRIHDRRPHPMSITEVVASNPALRPRISSQNRRGRTQEIEVEIAAGLPAGKHEERLEIRAKGTENPAFPESITLEVPITIVRPAAVSLAPDRLVLKRVDLADGRVLRNFLLIDRAGAAEIAEVKSADSHVTCTWRREGETLHRLRLTVAPGAQTSTLEIRMNDAARTLAVLPIRID